MKARGIMKTDSNITSEVKSAFERWMVDVYGGNLEITSTKSYASALNRITDHRFEHTKEGFDLYDIRHYYDWQSKTLDFQKLEKIRDDYDTSGKFADFGHEGHGTIRAAIKKYYEFCSGNRRQLLCILQNNTSGIGAGQQSGNYGSVPAEQAKVILASACNEMGTVVKKHIEKLNELIDTTGGNSIELVTSQERDSKTNCQAVRYQNMKVGKITQNIFIPLLNGKTIPDNVLQYLQDKDYSKQQFDINYPLLVKLSNALAKVPSHYYKRRRITMNGEYFAVCCEWYEWNKKYLIKWMQEFKNKYS